ncbi:MAG: protein kinase [Acidobacteria bacterium]|nr:protein kinase [Acidobacteriota bacterium]
MLSHYCLVEKIGEGGMGVVWKAEDSVLHRTVAIKVLPADAARDEKRRQMFLDEAHLAASVSDLHIVQVYELGRQEDLDFIVMEYVEGRPLSAIIHGRPLSSGTVATLGFQVARALSRAHRKGLLHRDLKPGNILVTAEGDVKVVDFGLATLFSPSDATDVTTASVAENPGGGRAPVARGGKGPLIGTIPYMSPEQARGEALDARSDIFALGAVLYEMTTGDRPFSGATHVEVLQEILKAHPVPVHERLPKVPLDLDRIIQKAMAPHRAERYQTMEDLAVDLKRLGRDLESGSSPSYDDLRAPLTRARRRRMALQALAAAAALAAVGLAAWFLGFRLPRWNLTPAAEGRAVLILPLEVRGQSEGADYVGRAFAEALAVSLAQSRTIRVLPVAATGQIGPDPMAPSRAALGAGAGRLLTGALVRDGAVVHASLSLVDAGENRILWGTRQDGEDANIPELALAMAREVAVELGAPLPRLYDLPQNSIIGSGIAASPLAIQAVGALQHHEVQAALEATKRLAEEFPKEPEALALRLRAVFAAWDHDRSAARRAELEKALADLERADPQHPAVEVSRAYVQSSEGLLREAIARFTGVLARSDLAPDLRADVLGLRGWNESQTDDTAAALADLEEALRLSPVNAEIFTRLAETLRFAGRLPDALIRARQAVALSPSDPWALVTLGFTLGDLGKAEEAVEPMGKACELTRNQSQCAAYASSLQHAGRKAEALAAAKMAEALAESGTGRYNLACFWAQFGNRGEALRSLRRSLELGVLIGFGERDPELISLHGDPEFEAYIAAVQKRLSPQ